MKINSLLQKYQTIFWDFDGVIKKSNKIKLIAFQKLFEGYGMQDEIKKHHINNQGISRFKKIPIYLEFCKIEKTEQNINDFCNRYSKLVVDEVINSEVQNFVKIDKFKRLFYFKSRINALRIWKIYFLSIYLKSLKKL